jgi:DNA topoisomerase IA
LIARHFLACVSEDAIGKETTVQIDVNGEKVNLKIRIKPDDYFIRFLEEMMNIFTHQKIVAKHRVKKV